MTDTLSSLVRRVTPAAAATPESLLDQEWLVTNGLGGYASASVTGTLTRKYHGVLVASLANPTGRMVMLNHLVECVALADGTRVQLTGEERTGQRLTLPALERLKDFRLEGGLPVWEFAVGDAVLEKRLVMPHRQNTTYLVYRLVGGSAPIRLELRPAVHFRGYEAEVTTAFQENYRITLGAIDEIACDGCPATLRLLLRGADKSFTYDPRTLPELHYRVEEHRGYASEGMLWSPGTFSVELAPNEMASLVASTEAAETMLAMSPDDAFDAERERRIRLLRTVPPAARSGPAAELVLAADQFVILPAGRRRDSARATAEGDEIRSVIAGYHWFTDWGRDTMISLEGLTLSTGRVREAASILRTFARYVRDGLLPNMFPDGSNEGLYHTADATLWFFHALDRYRAVSGDDELVARLLPTMTDVAQRHLDGTRFGIGVDPVDGLLREGQDGYALTWMDANWQGWLPTPRRGKPVEINALWYNALRVLESWTRAYRSADAADVWGRHADRARDSFNARFWYDAGGYLYDLVDRTEDGASSTECRPNQLLAVSLPNAVLDESRWASVVGVVERTLVTPYGLRSLAPGSPNYSPKYFGVLRDRDAAYHQGTVWGWLIGPWIDAWRKVHPEDTAGARRWLDALIDHLGEFGVGSIAEIFDAEAPYTPRGCVAQAWSVAEVLRHLVA